jgi:hypothetical protein
MTDEVGIRETLKIAKLGPFRAASHTLQHSPSGVGSNKGDIWVPGSRNGFLEPFGPVRQLYLSYFRELFVPVHPFYRS